eukprot:Rmarinus@m.18393
MFYKDRESQVTVAVYVFKCYFLVCLVPLVSTARFFLSYFLFNWLLVPLKSLIPVLAVVSRRRKQNQAPSYYTKEKKRERERKKRKKESPAGRKTNRRNNKILPS